MMMVIRVSVPKRKALRILSVIALDEKGNGYDLEILNAYLDDKKQTVVKIGER